ncbi:MAG: FHA domain-containing protein [Hyphomicrobiaceae bacterium]|nr:FHA domain-containing protein [Hyphomicrobiaceae bacterium]
MPYELLPASAGVALPFGAAGLGNALAASAGQAFGLIAGAYQRAPVLVLALSALLVLPLVALVSLATQWSRRRMLRRSVSRAARLRAKSADLSKELPEPMRAAAPQSQAWLTVIGRPGGPMALAGDLIRIGRHEDNDIRLPDWSVYRHHAVIERTPEKAFVIADVSGKDGSGVRVNGAPTTRTQLADGDVIELGRAKLRFENTPL